MDTLNNSKIENDDITLGELLEGALRCKGFAAGVPL